MGKHRRIVADKYLAVGIFCPLVSSLILRSIKNQIAKLQNTANLLVPKNTREGPSSQEPLVILYWYTVTFTIE